MKDGYIRVAAGRVAVAVGDPEHNKGEILARIREADAAGVNLLVLPELCLTGASCGDLFYSETLLEAARCAAEDIVHETEGLYPVVVFGLPLSRRGKLYNCAAVAQGGKLLGVVAKSNLTSDDLRYFAVAENLGDYPMFELAGYVVRLEAGLVFTHRQMKNYAFGVTLGEDGGPLSAMARVCAGGATVVLNASASPEIVGAAEARRTLAAARSADLCCAFVCANADVSESTQDTVCSAHHLIVEAGRVVAEKAPFEDKNLLIAEVDVSHLSYDRRVKGNYPCADALCVVFDQELREHELTMPMQKNPFVPADAARADVRAEEVLQIQSRALARRIEHTFARRAVIGISGGLDSTLALLVAVRAMDILGRPRADVLAITMPGFGTTSRTRSNAVVLCEQLGVSLRQISIAAAVKQHFADIGHAEDVFDVTYENAQARERTQVLMDVANQENGLVIGTGDLSELALGWATYNGDHMSMYAVNADVPKTMVRSLVRYEAERLTDSAAVLLDILDTPVSPELLPADARGNIAQKTEDLVGPYELHDFFLYYLVRYGDTPAKIMRMAKVAFDGDYDDATILRWLRIFHRRFFNQQFKRSCMPDGPRVLDISLSPRGDWHMPSDATSALWLRQIEALEKGE